MKNILESRIVSSAMRKQLDPFMAMFNLKNNYGWKDDPSQSARDDKRLDIEMTEHTKRLSDARRRAMLEDPDKP